MLNLGTLDLKRENAGIEGDISIANAANAIGTLASSVATGAIKGDIHVVDGAGGLIVTGNFSNVASSQSPGPTGTTIQHATTIVTTGDLTLASGAKLAATTGKDVVLAAQGGAFVNHAGATAVTPGSGGRFLIYSNAPATTTAGGLVGAPVYNKTYAANAPAGITQTGSRFLYTLVPTLTFTADSLARLYGAANPTLTATVSGLVGGDTAGAAYAGTPVVTTAATSASNAGPHAITAAAGTVVASDYDYRIAFAPGVLTINPAPLTITADNSSKSAGTANPAFTASFSGFVNGDTAASLTGLDFSTTATTGSPAGTYPITPFGATNANYALSFANGVLTVNGVATLTITADNLAKLYGAALPTFTATMTGFNNGDTAGVVSGLTFSTVATAGAPVGTYAIVPSGASASGYQMSYVNGTLTIDPAALQITVIQAERLYGESNPTFGVTYTGLVNGDTSSVVGGLALDTTATAASNVGTYAITATGATASNYTITPTHGTLTIGQAPLTLTVANVTKTYADLNPTATATASGLVLDQSLADVGTLAFSTPVTQFTGVGDYSIGASLTGGLSANYAITVNRGAFSITPRPVTLVADSGTRVYGDANPTLGWTLQGTDPAGTTNLALLDTRSLQVSGLPATNANVGSYDVSLNEITNGNFSISYAAGALTVTPAPLTITAGSAARTYGDANPVFAATASGLKLTDTLSDLVGGLAVTSTANAASNAGTYAVTASGTALTSNYDLTFAPGTLTVNKAALFIAPALSSRFYGDADPAFSLAATGLRNGDTVGVVTGEVFSGSAPTAGVGTVPITLLGATARNYDLTFGAGTMNVLPRPLIIAAADASRVYGDANPTFTASFDNLAGFDTAAAITGLTLATSATATSSVVDGGYGITVASNANRNYAITYAPGRLTVTPAVLDFGVGSYFRTYGQADLEFDAALVSGLKLSDTPAMLGVSVAGPAVTADVGTYPVTVSLTNPNYTVSAGSTGELQILPALIRINVGNVARRYGYANPDVADVPLAVSGLAFGQTALDAVALDFGVDATAGVGNYPIGASLISPNYQIADLTLGNLAVLVRQIALKPATVIRAYGDNSPAYAILVGADGLAAFDTIGDVAFTDLLNFDGTLIGGLPGAATDVGVHQLRVELTGNPNYEVASVAGLFAVLPRPVTLTTQAATVTENQDLPIFSTIATNLPAGVSVLGAFPDLAYNVYAEDVAASVGTTYTTATYPVSDTYADAAFVAKYPAPATSAAALDGGYEMGVIVPIDTPAFPSTEVTSASIAIPLNLGSNGRVSPAATAGADAPVIRFAQANGYQSNPNYVVTAVTNGTVTVNPDPVLVAQRRQAIEDAAAANELNAARAAFLMPGSGPAAFGLTTEALPALVGAVYAQIATEKFGPTFDSILQARIAITLGKEPGEGFTEAELYRLLAQIPHNLEVRALFAPVMNDYIRGLIDKPAASYTAADAALVATVNERLAANQATMASAAKQAAEAELAAYQEEQARTGADRNLINLFGRDIPYDDIVKSALGSVVEESMGTRLNELLDGMDTSTGANLGLTVGTAAVAGTASYFAAGSTVAALLPFSVGRGLEIGTTVAQVMSTAASNAGGMVGGTVAAAVVMVAVMSVQRGIAIGDNEGQRLIYEGLVNGTFETPTLAGMNLDQTKGNGTKKLQAGLNENLLSLAIFDVISG